MVGKTATVQDVARVAGVSTATVSRALNTPAKVSERTRESVLAAVRATGYRANQAARNLRTQRTGAILVVVPNLANPFFANILSGIESVLKAAGYNVLITDTGADAAKGARLSQYLSSGQADGLIVLDGSIDAADVAGIEVRDGKNAIVFACEWLDAMPFPSVRSDNQDGILQAVEHLTRLGHTKIGHITGPLENVLARCRLEKFERALLDKGLELKTDWVIKGDFSLCAGRDAAGHYLRLPEKPTALVCASDQIAFGLISTLSAQGVSVPEDLSVVGFDNVEMAEFFQPPLTTIHQHRNQLGAAAAREVLELLSHNKRSAARIETIPVRFVERGSTAPPAAGG
jgi:LacI family transcriptional regulator, repressor for deo operon, udp, cdd, tsx, nupC, and nupG